MIILTILASVSAAIILCGIIALLGGSFITLALFGDIIVATLLIWLIVRIIQKNKSEKD